jgi:Cytochrome C oxidase, cbb3-type, subunit III
MAWPSPRLRHRVWMRCYAVAVLAAAIAAASAMAQDGAVEKGERLYAKYCATCHGDDLQNNSGVAFDLRRLTVEEHPVSSIRFNMAGMPCLLGRASLAQSRLMISGPTSVSTVIRNNSSIRIHIDRRKERSKRGCDLPNRIA